MSHRSRHRFLLTNHEQIDRSTPITSPESILPPFFSSLWAPICNLPTFTRFNTTARRNVAYIDGEPDTVWESIGYVKRTNTGQSSRKGVIDHCTLGVVGSSGQQQKACDRFVSNAGSGCSSHRVSATTSTALAEPDDDMSPNSLVGNYDVTTGTASTKESIPPDQLGISLVLSGKQISIFKPPPGRLLARIVPPCASTARRAIARPRP